jgi:hypothetical protein
MDQGTWISQVLWITLRHLGKEALFLQLLKQTHVDELFGPGGFRLRVLRSKIIEQILNSLESWIRPLRNTFDESRLSCLESLGIRVA